MDMTISAVMGNSSRLSSFTAAPEWLDAIYAPSSGLALARYGVA
jgi:hypothetical protein